MVTDSGRKRHPAVWVAVAAVLIVTVVAMVMLFRPPSRRVVIAAGPVGSPAYQFAERYRAILAREGVVLEVLATAGPLDNLARLRDPEGQADVGLLSGGTTSVEAAPGLVSLGTVYYTPAWLFHRGRVPKIGEAWPRDLRVALGPEGGSLDDVGRRHLTAVGYPTDAPALALAPAAAAESLLHGRVDMVAMVEAWESPEVRALLAGEKVELAVMPRVDAHVALYPYLTKLTLPQGVADLIRNRPPTDVHLMAPKVSLVVKSRLNSALQYLLLDAATEVHGGAGIFQRAGQFPAAERDDLVLSRAAVSYYKSGTPFLQRHLPFWVAVLLTQLGLILLPVVGIAYPLLRGFPALYRAWMRSRLNRLYAELRLVEAAVADRPAGPHEDLAARLDQLAARASGMRVTSAYLQALYFLRQHIDLVRSRLVVTGPQAWKGDA
jgi:TRAP-type uncharacterized transport system substrate-binding protein